MTVESILAEARALSRSEQLQLLDELEDYLLENDPHFWQEIESARQEYATGQTMSFEDYDRRRLGQRS